MGTVTADALPSRINIRALHGDTWQQLFRFASDGAPTDLTGLEFAASARGTTGAVTGLVVTVVDAADGTIRLAPPAEGLPADVYDYDIQTTDAGTTETWIWGRLQLRRDVTP